MYPPLPRRLEVLAKSLGTPHGRKKSGLAVLEGIRVAEGLTASGAVVNAVLVSPEALRDPRAAGLAAGFSSRGLPVYEVSAAALRGLSQVETPQGLLIICEPPRVTLETALLHPFLLIADAIQDPGNLGTILRLASAFGVGAVVTTKGTVEVSNPKTVRAAAGAWPGLPVAEGVNPESLVRLLKASGHRIVVADAHGSPGTRANLWMGHVALVAGSEGHGAGAVFATAATARVRIPLAPGVESLNVGSAVAILLAEAARRRGF